MNNYVWNCHKTRGIAAVGIGYGVRLTLWPGPGDCSHHNSSLSSTHSCPGLGFHTPAFPPPGASASTEGTKKRPYIKDTVKSNWMWMISMRDDWGKGLKEIIITWPTHWQLYTRMDRIETYNSLYSYSVSKLLMFKWKKLNCISY